MLCIGGNLPSPLAQGRGLKPNSVLQKYIANTVAPRAGAWIETSNDQYKFVVLTSPLAQGRGFKLTSTGVRRPDSESPLAQGRGLKREG